MGEKDSRQGLFVWAWDDWESALDRYIAEVDFIQLHQRLPRPEDYQEQLTMTGEKMQSNLC